MGKLFNLFFFGIFAVILCSLLMLGYFLYTGDEEMWGYFLLIPLVLYIAHSWFLMIALCYRDFRKPKYPLYAGERISVIMPCYNEEPELLKKAVESVLAAEGNKEIILVNDGSTNKIRKTMHMLHRRYDEVRLIEYQQNKGKRIAIWHAVKKLDLLSQFIVCLDSDTIIDKQALLRIVEPLKDKRIGASTGNILVLNEKQNWITKINAAYYWTGLNIYKQAQSVFGSVACCSGCLSAYRADVTKRVIDEFINERFFGELCTHSEDRHLTNLVLREGWRIVYVPEAISYTETPSTIKGFINQQKRWKRGFLRESVYALTFTWHTHPILFLWILLWDIGLPFLIFGAKIILVTTIITHPAFFLTTVVPVWLTWTAIRYMIVIFRAPSKLLGVLAFSFFSEIVLYWLTLYALVTIKNRNWVTR